MVWAPASIWGRDAVAVGLAGGGCGGSAGDREIGLGHNVFWCLRIVQGAMLSRQKDKEVWGQRARSRQKTKVGESLVYLNKDTR